MKKLDAFSNISLNYMSIRYSLVSQPNNNEITNNEQEFFYWIYCL